MLGQVMPHLDTWTTAQKEAVDCLHKYSPLLRPFGVFSGGLSLSFSFALSPTSAASYHL